MGQFSSKDQELKLLEVKLRGESVSRRRVQVKEGDLKVTLAWSLGLSVLPLSAPSMCRSPHRHSGLITCLRHWVQHGVMGKRQGPESE